MPPDSALTPMLLGVNWLDPQWILTTVGTVPTVLLVLAIIFIECAIFPILPGDSLLFVMGLFIANATLHVPIWLAIAVVCVAAWLGNVAGYSIGRAIGPNLFKPGARVFKQEYADRTHAFFERFGPRAVILGRFVPIVRTVITLLAGVGRMSRATYLLYSAIGAVLWAAIMTLAGYWLGHIDIIRTHVDAFTVLVIIVSLVPVILHRVQARTAR